MFEQQPLYSSFLSGDFIYALRRMSHFVFEVKHPTGIGAVSDER